TTRRSPRGRGITRQAEGRRPLATGGEELRRQGRRYPEHPTQLGASHAGRRRAAVALIVTCAVAFAPGAITSSNMPVEEFHETFTIFPESADASGGSVE